MQNRQNETIVQDLFSFAIFATEKKILPTLLDNYEALFESAQRKRKMSDESDDEANDKENIDCETPTTPKKIKPEVDLCKIIQEKQVNDFSSKNLCKTKTKKRKRNRKRKRKREPFCLI